MQNDDVYKSQRVSTDKTGTLVYKSVIETKKPKLPIMSYSLKINSTLLHTRLQGWCVLGMVNSDTSSKKYTVCFHNDWVHSVMTGHLRLSMRKMWCAIYINKRVKYMNIEYD